MIEPIKTLVAGQGGGSSPAVAPSPHVPVEEANTVQANTIIRLVDILCEGEIKGWAIDDNIYKSTYLNETPVMAVDGTMNFEGVTLVANSGTVNQDYLKGFDAVEAEGPEVNALVTKAGGPITRTITNLDIDDVRITLKFPRLVSQEDDGDLRKTTVSYHITVTPDNGAGTEQTAKTETLTAKCMSEYRRPHLIENLSDYGVGPWVIKVYRDTDDSDSSKLLNDLWWYSYTEIINVKLRYPDTVAVGITIDMKSFGSQIPSRKYRLKGRLIQYPSNYDPTTREYTGIWDGTFTTGYCNNPAWVTYDMIVNDRFGIGLSPSLVDKWTLYTIAQYCDGDVTYTQRARAADDTYTETSITQPRFTFNGIIQNRQQALAVLTHMCSVFRGFPIWSTGMVSFIQDAPKEITRIASPANVKDGFFEYEGSDQDVRSTAVKVSYTNMDNFGRSDIIIETDPEGLARYGYNPVDLVAFGCNNPYEASLRGKFHLYTNLNQTEIVRFVGGEEWADAKPGELIGVQDPDYANKNLSGRIVSSTDESITVDRDIEIETGVTYTLLIQSATTNAVHEVRLTNTVGTTRLLTWSGAIVPNITPGFVFVLSSSSVAVREFEIIQLGDEKDGEYPIAAMQYSPDKYSEIEQGIIVEAPPEMDLPVGKLQPPSDIAIQPYTYTEGDLKIRKYAMLISWVQADDARVMGYEVIASYNGGGWYPVGPFTAQISMDYKDVLAGTYDIGVRAKGVAGESNWVYFNDFVMGAAVDAPAPPTNLHCVDDPANDYFTGPDCEISWTASAGSNYTVPADGSNDIPFKGAAGVGDSNVAGYKIEVYDGITLKRTHYTQGRDILSWVYTFAMNAEDNTSPIRAINFRVYTVDVKGVLSLTYASVSASNPAPSMAAQTPTILSMAGYIDISWSIVSDNDMSKYEIKVGSTVVGAVAHPMNNFQYHDVKVGTDYTVQIVPWDQFGVGTGSQTDTGSPVVIPAVNLDVELSASMEKSDSDGNTAATLEKLYDGVEGSNGVSYTLSGTDKYIQYKYAIENYFDRMAVYTADANARVYIAYSTDGITWSYLKADTDHTVDATGKMTAASSQADAVTNYFQCVAGTNLALFPNNLVAKYVRLYLTGTYSTTLYEFIPVRMLISELAAIGSLSAISANIGLVEAGVIQSSTTTTSGASTTKIDLTNGKIQIYDESDTLRVLIGDLS